MGAMPFQEITANFLACSPWHNDTTSNLWQGSYAYFHVWKFSPTLFAPRCRELKEYQFLFGSDVGKLYFFDFSVPAWESKMPFLVKSLRLSNDFKIKSRVYEGVRF